MPITIALAGNPNSGKTTMFNDLTGSTQYVGNWPGVTVEKKEGKYKADKDIVIQDLPGIYSLSPYTLEEVVARNYLINERPDAIINIVDGSNLERNLYLTTQLTELGIPVVVALNMIDVVRKNNDKIDIEKLGDALGCTVVETSALKGEGTDKVLAAAADIARTHAHSEPPHNFGGTVEHAIAHIEEVVENKLDKESLRWYSIKLFERDEEAAKHLDLSADEREKLEKIVADCETELDDDSESIITNERYAYINKVIDVSLVRGKPKGALSTSDKIDRIVTNRWLALPIFVVIMFIVYFVSVTTIGGIATDFANDTIVGGLQELAGGWFDNLGMVGWLNSLLVDGVIGGVGAVIGFVPQMLVLFFFLAILEECGYMARIAFIMDRVFRKFGLSGKSFIPMLISTGCAVPGIMATRTIENDRDRRMTVMTTSFMPCGAKLPIIALIAGALFGGAWWVAPSAYFLGIFSVIVSGIILKKTKMFEGDPAPFVMELPAYHRPTVGAVLRSMWERGWSFIKRAGTVILLASIVIWTLSRLGFVDGSLAYLDEEIDASILAAIGRPISYIFKPLGFGSWQATVATVMGLVAKEEVVGVFGVLFGVAGDALELVEEGMFNDFGGIATAFTGITVTLSAYSYLVFNLLCAPCFAAIGAIRREMRSAKWTWFAIGYQTIYAYAMSLIIYQFGALFSGGGFNIWTGVAFLVVVLMIYLLFRPGHDKRTKAAKAA